MVLHQAQSPASHHFPQHIPLAHEDLATAAPAAGKTRFALRVAHQYLTDRAASRVLVICPTNHLRNQWATAAGHVGIHLDPALSNGQACEARDYHGAVVTYQQVCLVPTVFQRACPGRRTLVIFDELHHAGDGKDWGKALRESFGDVAFRRPVRSGRESGRFHLRVCRGHS